MTPVFQTIVSNPDESIHGNCFPACIASILELSIEEVPEFQKMGDKWFPTLWDFLHTKGCDCHGTGRPEKVETYEPGVNGYYVVNGGSPRGFKRGHSVVYYKGKLIHDPYHGGNGLTKVWNFLMIEPIVSY